MLKIMIVLTEKCNLLLKLDSLNFFYRLSINYWDNLIVTKKMYDPLCKLKISLFLFNQDQDLNMGVIIFQQEVLIT